MEKILILLLCHLVSGGQEFSFNYIPSGKLSEEEMFKEMPVSVSGASSPGGGGGAEYGPPTTDEKSFMDAKIAYFPHPDDDGSYIRVDMNEEDTSGLTFHVGLGARTASLVMNIPGWKFGAHQVQEKEVKFYLFTKKVQTREGIELFSSEKNSDKVKDFWMEGAEVKILCHGYMSSYWKPFPRLMMQSYVELEKDLNVILVDWHGLAEDILYFSVAKETTGVGQRVGALVRQLVLEGLTSLDQVHFIGHSLGAQIGGATGFTLQQTKVGKLKRITGLDPAGPGFCDNGIGRLEESDAEFVDVIHTDDSAYCQGYIAWIWNLSKGKWGSDVTTGHSNFFPNGGHKQPGCGTGVTDTCSHSRAYYYMQESFNDTSTIPTVFKGCPCHSYRDYLAGNCLCSSDNYVPMGEYTPTNTTEGKYFLKTGRKYPYSHVVG